MNNYTKVAKQKIKQLSAKKDFIKVITENERYTIIEFESLICKVTNFGNVTWGEKYE